MSIFGEDIISIGILLGVWAIWYEIHSTTKRKEVEKHNKEVGKKLSQEYKAKWENQDSN